MPTGEVQRNLVRSYRSDLAALLDGARHHLEDELDPIFGEEMKVLVVACHTVCASALSFVGAAEKELIIQAYRGSDRAVLNVQPVADNLRIAVDASIAIGSKTEVVGLLMAQRGMMIAVATGGPPINTVNEQFRARRRRLSELLGSLGLQDPSPHDDLWAWFQYYKANLGGYADRRSYCNELFNPSIDQVLGLLDFGAETREATGWDQVDRVRASARKSLEDANHTEDLQTVGLKCREVLISLGQAVYDAERHHSADGVTPSSTDAKRMLEAYVVAEVAGPENEEIRRHAKASLALALALQHKRTASHRDAALCVEATESTVNVIAIIEKHTRQRGG